MKNILTIFLCLAAYSFAQAQIARGHHKFFGNIMKTSDPNPVGFNTYWNQTTPENAGKWNNVEDELDVMEWNTLDAMTNYSYDNNFQFKHHAFIWGKKNKIPEGFNNLSDEEQLYHIEEWIRSFCERYGDQVQMIDVVNEPLHETPAFKSALGGDNDIYGTGWDWVIKTYEIAREHCPNAELILNDYNLLNITNTTNKFLPIVEELKKRNLIDAIGCQAHTLENVSTSKIENNLDLLINTGVDVYISELDLNFSNDNQQKNKYQDIFPLFWENNKVKGVTLWGYKEGTTWRPYTHLLRNDGSERPALIWLKSYIANYADPVFEAELFDEGVGVTKYDGYVGDIDNNDWIKYTNINFGDGFAGVKFKYAKGDNSTSEIEIRHGSVNGTLLGSFNLNNTGGWSSYLEDSVQLSSNITGIIDIVLVFKGALNLDFFSLLNDFNNDYHIISNSTDDAEEKTDNSVDLQSGDLDLGEKPINGLRFNNIDIPQGATITNAYIQFAADKDNQTAAASYTIKGEDVDDAATFTSANGNLSNRTLTAASVNWNNIAAWNTAGESADAQKTPDLSSVIQEIVDRPSWSIGNSLVLIVSGTSGKRSAITYDNDSQKAPKLVIEYELANSYQVSQSADDAEQKK